jgi:uncharacterized protein
MWKLIRRTFLSLLAVAVAVFVVGAYRNWDLVQRVFLGGLKIYETTPPTIPADIKRPAILSFSKTNGFRHEAAITAGNKLLSSMAIENGWGYFQTENGATFSPEILARFDVVIFNNTSGDVFTPQQKEAFKNFVEQGGGYIGLHAAGDSSHSWAWHVSNLIGAKFTGHPMRPQFQKALVQIEDAAHPATLGLPATFLRTDEWYSFATSPRAAGFNILATIDEASYKPIGMFGKNLAMGKDHPIIWWNCAGKGRILYSAMGHTAETFAEPYIQKMLLGSLKWTLRQDGSGCDKAP